MADVREQLPNMRLRVASGRMVKRRILNPAHQWRPRRFILYATTSGGRVRLFDQSEDPYVNNPDDFVNLRKEVEFVGQDAAVQRPQMRGPMLVNRLRAWVAAQGGSCNAESRVAVVLRQRHVLHFGLSSGEEARLIATLMNGCDLTSPGFVTPLFSGLELAVGHPIVAHKFELHRLPAAQEEGKEKDDKENEKPKKEEHMEQAEDAEGNRGCLWWLANQVRSNVSVREFGPWTRVGYFNGRPSYMALVPVMTFLYWDHCTNRWTAFFHKKCQTLEQWRKRKEFPAFFIYDNADRLERVSSPIFFRDEELHTYRAEDLRITITGNIQVDAVELVRTLAIVCKQLDVAKQLVENPGVLEKLLGWCGWRYAGSSPPLLPHIVLLWRALGRHIRTCTEISQAFEEFLPSVLHWMVGLEFGISPEHRARAVLLHGLEELDGWYVLHPQEFNKRPAYYQPFQKSTKRRGDNYARPLAFLAWYNDEWRLTTSLDSSTFHARAKDDVMAVECAACTWQVEKRPDEFSEAEIVDDETIFITTPPSVFDHSQERLPNAITELCKVEAIGKHLSAKGTDLGRLLDRMLARTGGPDSKRAPVAAQADMINQIFSNPPTIAVALRVTGEEELQVEEAQLAAALFDTLQRSVNRQEFVPEDVVVSALSHKSGNCFSTSIHVTLTKNMLLFRTLLGKVRELSGTALTEPIAKHINATPHTLSVEIKSVRVVQDQAWADRGRDLREGLLSEDGIPKKLIAVFLKATAATPNFALGVDTLHKLLDLPVSLRHVDDPRAEPIKQQLVNIVAPRVLDIVLELITAEVDPNERAASEFCLSHMVANLADLCELPRAAEVVCRRDLALNTMLGVLVRATTTERDALDHMSELSRFQTTPHPMAVTPLLRLVAVLSNHVQSNEVVANGMFRADPIRTLVRVMQTGAADHAQQLAAYGLFKLCESSLEHRETAERHNAVWSVLQFLKTGSWEGQRRASFALEALLEDSDKRQAQFLEKHGVRPLVRILERERARQPASVLCASVQTIVVHLASLPESAGELVDAGAVTVLLKLLESRNGPTLGRVAAALLRLSFHNDLRKALIEADALKALTEASEQPPRENPALDGDELGDLQYDVQQRDRWQLGELLPHLKLWLLGVPNVPHSPPEERKHVMISYNWAHQDLFLKIKDALERERFEVWMDVERMQGNILDQMADAVEKAYVVILGVSSKYQRSDNCRSEAEYARHLKRHCIPCVVEKDFVASGWLGLVMGMKLYYDFSSPSGFESTMNNLVRELHAAKNGSLQALQQRSQTPAQERAP